MPTAKLALVGDRSPSVRAHVRIPLLVDALRRREGIVLDPYWIPSEKATDLESFDGVWVVPGSPYKDPERVIAAVRTARELEIPFLGTCGGFQHAILELARDVCGIDDAWHAEYGPEGEQVIVELECSLVGHEGVIEYTPGTKMAAIAGVDRSHERYHCSYGIADAYLERLQEGGVVFSAHDEEGEVRALELADHPFFLGTLFQPELAGSEPVAAPRDYLTARDGSRAHPVIRAFAEAVSARAGSTREALPASPAR